MTITSKTPSEQALITLKALQDAVTKNLELKKKLGHYVVTWQNGKPDFTIGWFRIAICPLLNALCVPARNTVSMWPSLKNVSASPSLSICCLNAS